MSQNQPLISIITTAYNAEKTLAETIQSVIDQDYPNKEYVIVNDGSTDKTTELAQSFEKQHSWIKVINTPNQGVAKARNTAWRASTGSYIAILDADDIYLPNALDKLYRGLIFCRETNPRVGLVYGNCIVFSESIENAKEIMSPPPLAQSKGLALRQLFIMNPVLPSASMFWRPTLEKLAGWDETLAWGQERDLMHRAALHFTFMKVNTPITYYRRHEGQRTSGGFGDVRYGADLAQFKFIQNYGLFPLFPEAKSPEKLASDITQLTDQILKQSRLKSFDTLLYMLHIAHALVEDDRYLKRIQILKNIIPQALKDKYGNGKRINISSNPFEEAEQIKQAFQDKQSS